MIRNLQMTCGEQKRAQVFGCIDYVCMHKLLCCLVATSVFLLNDLLRILSKQAQSSLWVAIMAQFDKKRRRVSFQKDFLFWPRLLIFLSARQVFYRQNQLLWAVFCTRRNFCFTMRSDLSALLNSWLVSQKGVRGSA